MRDKLLPSSAKIESVFLFINGGGHFQVVDNGKESVRLLIRLPY